MALQDDNFRDFLARRYSRRPSVISMVEMPAIGLSEAQLPDGGSTQDLWHAVLRLVRQEGTFDALVDEVSRQNAGDIALIQKLSPTWRDDKSAPQAINLANPYPGLRPFEEADHDRFYGRERWITDLGQSLDQHGFVTLYGGSGSGKSSLLRAGLMPKLKRAGHVVVLFTPGKNPFDSLLSMGLGNKAQAQSLVESAQKGDLPGLFAELAAKCFSGKRLVIIIDQGEELYTRCESAEVRETFLRCLFHDRGPKTSLLVGIREDFFDRWGKTPALSPGFGAANISLTPPDEGDWRSIILEPAQKHGVIFEAGLPEIMIERLRVARAGLPLLQFLLQKLWEHDNPSDGVLNRDSYDSLGGVDHALRGHIEAFLKKHPGREGEIRQMLFKLVRFTRQDGQYRALSRSCPVQDLPPDLANALLGDEWRLLTTRGQAGEVELSHEIILRVWPGFETMEQQRGALHALKSDITDACARWLPARQKSELWAGSRLEESLKHAGMPGVDGNAPQTDDFALGESPLSENEREFLSESHAKVHADRELYQTNLRNLHEASMADYSVAVRRIEKESKWNEGIAHLVRSLKWEPENPLAAARLYSTLSYHAAEKQTWPRQILTHKDRVLSAQFSADGTRIVTASWDNSARVWDAHSGKPIGEPLRHEDSVLSAQFSADGTRIVTASEDKTARVWDATSGQPLGEPLHHECRVVNAYFSADGTRIVTASWDNSARVWDAYSGKPLGEPLRHEGSVLSAQFNTDGTRIVTASEDKTARVWDAASGKPLGEPLHHDDIVLSAQFSRDGTRIVTASEDKTAQVWNAASRKPLGEPLRHEACVVGAQFSPDGTRIVTASGDTARFWDAHSGKPIGEPLRHEGSVVSAQFSADGTRVVTASFDKTARVWDSASGKPIGEPLVHEDSVLTAQFSADSTRIVTSSRDDSASVWDAASGQPLGEPLRHEDSVLSAQFSADGTRIITASWDKTARVWDAASGKPLGEPLRHEDEVVSAQFSADGTRVVTASWDKTARVWDAYSGKPIGEPLRHKDSVVSAHFSADGTRIVTASDDKTARVWDAHSGKPIGEPLRHKDGVVSAQFSADGTRIVTASLENAQVWDAASGQPLGEPLRHEHHNLQTVQFSADGTRIVTASKDKTARVWDAASGQPLSEPLRHNARVYSARFSADGTRIVTASADKTARVWDAASGQPLGEPLRHEDSVLSAQFSADGTRIFTASEDKTARVWDAASGKPLGEPLRHKSSVVSAQFSADGTRIVTASMDNTARVWDATHLTHMHLPVPPWMSEFAKALTGLRFTIEGDLQAIPVRERMAMLSEPVPGNDLWATLARWLGLPAEERTLTPVSRLNLRQLAEHERDTLLREGLESAIRYDPSVPMARLLLAKFEENPQRSAFLRDYDLKRLPADAALWARASKSLLEQQQPKLALEAAQKAVSLDTNLPAANEALSEALEAQKTPNSPPEKN